MTLREIATVVDGAVTSLDEGVVVTGPAFVDSRTPVPGGLFAAVVGERVDGHEYAAAAVEAGAAAVLASRRVDAPAVVVRDVPIALGALARDVIRRTPGLVVIGVTGSQGKTSTKDMLAAILGARGETVAPRESLNNEIGLPVTALRVDRGTRYLVAEMGTRGAGQIAYLADIVAPGVGVVLNIGVAHLGEFGTRDNIAAAKGELVEALPPDGLAVLNADDPRVLAMAARTTAPVLTFGTSAGADVRLSRVGLDAQGHTTLRLERDGRRADLTLGYYGEHQAMNAAAAVAAALGVGLDLDEAVAALRGVAPSSKWRMAVVTNPDGVVVINDAYNANPDSMQAALRALVDIAERHDRARTFAVLGEMRELGATSEAEHESLGRVAAALGVFRVVAVGEAARPVHAAASGQPGWTGEARFAAGPAEALSYLRGELRGGDVVLVKASRATGLEGLAAALEAGREPARRTGGGR